MEEIRISKFLSQCGVASRRKADELILSGKVKVNGKTVSELGAKIDPSRDQIQVRNKFVRPPERGVLLLHKPRGVVSTLDDPQGRQTVKHFLTRQYISYFPVGRLDYDSTGLLILTNDGELADRLMHPRYGFRRVYEAKVAGHINDHTIRRIERGIPLDDGSASAKIQIIGNGNDNCWLRVEVGEGRNRMVRRLLEKVGHPVSKLKRISHGPVTLGKLQPGEMRKLSQKEYETLRLRVIGEERRGKKKVQSRKNSLPPKKRAPPKPVKERQRNRR